MVRTLALLVALLAIGCWRGPASSAPSAPRSAPPVTKAEASYRNVTIAVDVIALSMIAGGAFLYRSRGLESSPGHVLVAAGGLTALGTPIIHGVKGHGARAGASYLIRAGLVSVGTLAAMEISCANDPGLFCGLTPNLWLGVAGGIAASSVIDALLLHGSSSTWSPTVTPTDGGARVGVATAF